LTKSSEEFEVDFYFSEKILKQLGFSQSDNVFHSSAANLLYQLSRKKYDLVIIGTLHRYFNVFNEVCMKYRTSVIVHNLNFSRLSKFHLFAKIFKKDFTYRLKLLLKEGLLEAPEIYKNASHLLVLDENLATENLKYLPVFYTKSQNNEKHPVFTVVIPGAVSQKRRDYRMIFSTIPAFPKNQRWEFVFLGKATGNELKSLQNLEHTKPEHVEIRYFTEKVNQREFDEWMEKADILWCPVQSETEFFSNPEIYGKTKMTGNIGDAIKYSKLAVVPEDYYSSFKFIIPQEKDIVRQFLALKEKHFDFEKKYYYDFVSRDLHQLLQAII